MLIRKENSLGVFGVWNKILGTTYFFNVDVPLKKVKVFKMV